MRTLGLALLLTASACSSLPSQGPLKQSIAQAAGDENANLSLIEVDRSNIATLSKPAVRDLSGQLHGVSDNHGAPRAQVGDSFVLMILENSEHGLFGSKAKGPTEFQMIVSSKGDVHIPYVGAVTVLGLTADQIRERIFRSLQGKAIDPEVLVTMKNSNAQAAAVIGDVRSPGKVPLQEGGLRLLDAIALSGGSRNTSYDTALRLVRKGQVAELPLEDVIRRPGNNIWLQPGDTVELIYRPRSFSAFGAIKSTGLVPFEKQTVTLAEALASVGGLNDRTADRGGVYLFRFESAERVAKAGGKVVPGSDPRQVPTVYRLDFSKPEAFFLASAIELQDHDILYVSNAPGTEIGKFISIILSPLLAAGSDYSAIQN